ncbi:putative membrane channel-forming protein YqfA (hemolysin III family) [Paenarthrobacter sp. TE4293]
MHTRSAVLVTAAAILASVQTTSWVSGWQVISIDLFVLAADLMLESC